MSKASSTGIAVTEDAFSLLWDAVGTWHNPEAARTEAEGEGQAGGREAFGTRCCRHTGAG